MISCGGLGIVITLALASTLGDATPNEREGAEPADDAAPVIRTLPASRGGQDLIGTRLPAMRFDAWLEGGEDAAPPRPGRPVLYRWWTDTCPYCEASLPAIERLRRRYAARGLAVVAVYHPKPPRGVAGARVRALAEERGYHGAVAIDRDWSALRAAYLDARPRRATSVSILVDGDGIVRFVHPGPVLFPSDDPRHAQESRDYAMLDAAVRAVLGSPPPDPPAGEDTP